MLADQRGSLRVIASSSEQARLVELFQLQHEQGPCLECYQTGGAGVRAGCGGGGAAVAVVRAGGDRGGVRGGAGLPMRLRDEVIGAMNLFMHAPGGLDATGVRVGQALADVATIGLLHERKFRHQEVLAEQLQGALNSRVTIEQAKGVLAERLGLDMGQAFELLRQYARVQNRRLAAEVAGGSENVAGWQAVSRSRSR